MGVGLGQSERALFIRGSPQVSAKILRPQQALYSKLRRHVLSSELFINYAEMTT